MEKMGGESVEVEYVISVIGGVRGRDGKGWGE